MFSKRILSTYKSICKPSYLTQYSQAYAFSSYGNTQLYSPLIIILGNLIKTDLFVTPEKRKRFYFDKNTTLANIESTLKKEDNSYQSVVFKNDNNEIQDKSLLFVDAF